MKIILVLALASVMAVAGCLGQTPFGGAGPNCGNNETDGDETCDPPGEVCAYFDANSGLYGPGLCSDDCDCISVPITGPYCGDNAVGAGEQCDPPGAACQTAGGQAGTCTNDCQCGVVGPPPKCGDQSVTPATGEECDPPGALCTASDGSTSQCTGQCKCPPVQGGQGPGEGPGQPPGPTCSQAGVQACSTATDCTDNPAPYYCNDGSDERSCLNNCCAAKTPACGDGCFTPGQEQCDSSYTGAQQQCQNNYYCSACQCKPIPQCPPGSFFDVTYEVCLPEGQH